MPQTAAELKTRVEAADLWPESTNEDRCDNCRYYLELREGIGYCAHRQLDMVVGGPWWCKLWAPNRATAAARSEEHTSELQSLRHLVCRLLLEKKKDDEDARDCSTAATNIR